LTVAVLFFGLGAALLTLAVPRSVAAITFVRQSVSWDVINGKRVPAADLANGVRIIEDALHWSSPPRYLFSLGLVEYQLALTLPSDSPDRSAWMDRAEQHTISALKASPADGYMWVWLAVIRQARGATMREILDPLITSLDVAPNRRELWKSRMSMLMYYWSALKPDELPIVRAQIRTIWSVPALRFFLYDTALKYGRRFNLLETLGNDPEAVEEIRTFDRNMAYP
jgi:hypothetical protein